MHGVKMKDNLNVSNLLRIYETEISKNVKNKKKLYDFEINKMQYIEDIINMLNNGVVSHKHYNIFLIFEPKCRLVMSLSVKDKVINHFVARYILEAKLSKYLDCRNVATRKGMGTDYAIRKVIKYINILKRKYKTFYVLKLDISKYFYSIDHEVLKGLLIDKLDDYEYNIVSDIIDTTNKEYINKTINKLKEAKEKIVEKLEMEYKLKVNGKKTWINNMKYGFSFLGYTYKVINNKTIVRIKRSNIEKIKKRVKEVRYLFDNNKISHYKAFCSIMTYSNCYKFSDNNKIYRIIDRYWYHEK